MIGRVCVLTFCSETRESEGSDMYMAKKVSVPKIKIIKRSLTSVNSRWLLVVVFYTR